MTLPNTLRAADAQEPHEEMQWTPEQHQNGFKQQQCPGSEVTGDQLDFARFGAQFDFSPVYPRSFQVAGSRRDLPFQFLGDRGDLSTQTAPPFRAEQRQVDDFRAFHTDSYVHQGHQNQTEQYGSVEGLGRGIGGTDFLGQQEIRGKTVGMDAGSPHYFTIHDDMNGLNGASKGGFRDYLPVPVHTPGTFKVDPVETINPAHLEQVPTLDPSWTLSSTGLRMPSTQDLVMRPKSKKRRRALREEEPHSMLINQHRREAVVNASGAAVVSAEAEELFEVWLSKFKSIYPGEQHFQALAALTEINIETVRLWFAQKWQRGMKTSITPAKTEVESPVTIAGLSMAAPQPAIAQAPHISLTGIRLDASTWVRNERGTKCTVAVNIAQLIRDSGKPYQCTMKCPKKFKDKDDWRKHEELNYPQEGWICDLEKIVVVDGHSICSFCGMMDPPRDHVTKNHGKAIACHEKAMTDRGRLHHRKQHFRQHFCNIHPNIPSSQYLDSSYFTVDSTFPRRCGFCVHKPTTWKDRIEHIGSHFIDGQDMTTWRDEDFEDEKADENENDRDGDHDHDGGSDDKDEFFSDEGSDSSDDDSDDAPRPSVFRQQDYRNNTSRYPQQGYNFTMPPSAGSPFLGGLRDLFRADSGVSLDGATASRRVSITPHAETPYTRVKLLGVGPYSVVDEVQDIRTGVILARKTVHSSNKVDSRSLKNEVDIMKRLRHPHIVQFLGTYEVGSSISILMNPAADYDLAYFMETHVGESRPGVEVVIQWFSCLVSSVRYIHEQSVRHQDIKPSNILLKNGIIMLADFGIAKTFSDSESTSSTAGAMTKKYCAPETSRLQPRGRSADIFSLGCVLLEMLSFLIYDGEPTFKEFQASHFSGDLAYHENIPQLKNWMETLQNHPSVGSTSFEHFLLTWSVNEALTPDLSKIVDTIQPMLDDEPWNRPTALELSARFPPKLCCLSPVEKPSEEVGFESQTSATLSIEKVYDMHATNRILPPPRTQVSLYNNRPMSPTTSLNSSLVSSRRESHFDFLAASFISTPRTSVGSISHYSAAVSAKVKHSVVELSKDDDNQLSKDDVSESDHDLDSTPSWIYGSPNSIYDDTWKDENLVTETRDRLRHKSLHEEIYEFEDPPPISFGALGRDEGFFEAQSRDSAGLPGRIDSPWISLTLLHDPPLTRWNAFNSRLKAIALVIIMLLGAFVAQVLNSLYVKYYEMSYLHMFFSVASCLISIIAPIRYVNAETTTSHGVSKPVTRWQAIMFCLIHLLAGPINSLLSLIQNKSALNRRHLPTCTEVVTEAANSHTTVKLSTRQNTLSNLPYSRDETCYWKGGSDDKPTYEIASPLDIPKRDLKSLFNTFATRHGLSDIVPQMQKGAFRVDERVESSVNLDLKNSFSERSLIKGRSSIAICCSLGTGLLLFTGSSMPYYSPISVLFSFFVTGFVVIFTMLSLAEMVSIPPMTWNIFASLKLEFFFLSMIPAALLFFQTISRSYFLTISHSTGASLSFKDFFVAPSVVAFTYHDPQLPISEAENSWSDFRVGYRSSDMTWVVASMVLVFLMIPAVALIYSGLARRKSALSLICLSVMATAMISFQWIFWGFYSMSSYSVDALINYLISNGAIDSLDRPIGSFDVHTLLLTAYQGMFTTCSIAIAVSPVKKRGHSSQLIIGTALFWIGWFGFNSGSIPATKIHAFLAAILAVGLVVTNHGSIVPYLVLLFFYYVAIIDRSVWDIALILAAILSLKPFAKRTGQSIDRAFLFIKIIVLMGLFIWNITITLALINDPGSPRWKDIDTASIDGLECLGFCNTIVWTTFSCIGYDTIAITMAKSEKYPTKITGTDDRYLLSSISIRLFGKRISEISSALRDYIPQRVQGIWSHVSWTSLLGISCSVSNGVYAHLDALVVSFNMLDRFLFNLGLGIRSSLPHNKIKARAGVKSRTTQLFLLSFVILSFCGLWTANITRRTTATFTVSSSRDYTTASPTIWDSSEARCISQSGQFKPLQSCKIDTVEMVVYNYQILKVSPMDLESIYKITLGTRATQPINRATLSAGQTVIPPCSSRYAVEASPTAGGRQRETITTTEAGLAKPYVGKIPLANQPIQQSSATTSSPQESISSFERFWNLLADIALNSEENVGTTLASETNVEEPGGENQEFKLPHLPVYIYASLFETVNTTHLQRFPTVGWNCGTSERRTLQLVSTIATWALAWSALYTTLNASICAFYYSTNMPLHNGQSFKMLLILSFVPELLFARYLRLSNWDLVEKIQRRLRSYKLVSVIFILLQLSLFITLAPSFQEHDSILWPAIIGSLYAGLHLYLHVMINPLVVLYYNQLHKAFSGRISKHIEWLEDVSATAEQQVLSDKISVIGDNSDYLKSMSAILNTTNQPLSRCNECEPDTNFPWRSYFGAIQRNIPLCFRLWGSSKRLFNSVLSATQDLSSSQMFDIGIRGQLPVPARVVTTSLRFKGLSSANRGRFHETYDCSATTGALDTAFHETGYCGWILSLDGILEKLQGAMFFILVLAAIGSVWFSEESPKFFQRV